MTRQLREAEYWMKRRLGWLLGGGGVMLDGLEGYTEQHRGERER